MPTDETCPLADRPATVPYSPIVSTKMKIEPITMPGIVCGRITSLNVWNQLPPRSRAASMRVPVDLAEQEEERRDHEQDVELDHREPDRERREAERVDRLADDVELDERPG